MNKLMSIWMSRKLFCSSMETNQEMTSRWNQFCNNTIGNNQVRICTKHNTTTPTLNNNTNALNFPFLFKKKIHTVIYNLMIVPFFFVEAAAREGPTQWKYKYENLEWCEQSQ